jgi:ankyrin repeat protein
MSSAGSLPYHARHEQYQQQADALFNGLRAGDEQAQWRFKWLHPRFRGKPIDDVKGATLTICDAQLVVALEYSFENWNALAAFVDSVALEGPVSRFESAVERVISGDAVTLRSMLRNHPELAQARSTRRHHATLLHYIAANGVEGGRQRTPPNAVEVARLLLEAGAEVDALADMYDHRCTTMSMLVSSCHPAQAGLQGALAETLLDHGAALKGPGSEWQSALMTALAFRYLDTAKTLAGRGAPADALPAVAGLGRLDDAQRLLPHASSHDKHVALALAAQHGHTGIVSLLLDAGEDPNRLNPDGFHSHSAPLHQAICAGHEEVVRLLVQRGARLDFRDTIYRSTPLGWAIHCEKPAIADHLRSRSALTGDSRNNQDN